MARTWYVVGDSTSPREAQSTLTTAASLAPSTRTTVCARALVPVGAGGPGVIASEVAERLDLGAQLVEPLGQVLVAAVDDVRRPEHRGAFRGEHGQEDDHRRPERGRTHDLGAGPARRSLHHHPVGVEQLHLATKLVELDEVDGAVLVDPVVDQGLA